MNHNATRYTITSALPYANGPLHIGHLAGAILPADIYARFLRAMGKDVLYVCGSDEHGAAITVKAIQEQTTAKAITDQYHQLFEDTFRKLNISFDIYHRTSAALHHETSQDFFRDLFSKEKLITRTTQQYFDPEAKQFLADRYIMGTCPNCGFEEAYGDQCENCGRTLNPMDLKSPQSKLSGAQPILKETTHWYLPLNQLEDWLQKWINEGEDEGVKQHDPQSWKNHVLGQCKSWLDGGLQERAMTRDLDWGVDVPQELEGAEGKKLYVWLDAPIGYISASKQWSEDHGKDWKPYWMDKDTQLIHFIGKDNIVFHCLIFPSILKIKGDYILPTNVPANQFLNLEGQKISTSRNWAVWAHEFIDENPDRLDEMRYYLTRIMPEQKDAEFTWTGFQETCNNELVNNLANFCHRVMVLTNKYFDGKIPTIDMETPILDPEGEYAFFESEMLVLHDQIQLVNEEIRKFNFRNALQLIMGISSRGNQLLQINEPWKKIKDEPEKVSLLLNLCCQYLAGISASIHSFLPDTALRIEDLLNCPLSSKDNFLVQLLDDLASGETILSDGHQINSPKHLFSRIEDEWINKQVEKLKESSVAQNSSSDYPPIADYALFEDFMKVDLRVGTILSAEKMKKADKLLQLEIDLGFEKRTVVSGIAQYYSPDQLPGKQVIVVANLEPRKLRGVMSNGMILMASDAEDNLCFVSPEKHWPNGYSVK